MTTPTSGATCPSCGAATVPIVYGYPGADLWEASERGEVVLGGCMVYDGRPTRRCPACGESHAPARADGRRA